MADDDALNGEESDMPQQPAKNEVQLVDDVRYHLNIQMPKNRALERKQASALGLTLEGALEVPQYVALDRAGWIGLDMGFRSEQKVDLLSERTSGKAQASHGVYLFELARIPTPLHLLQWVHHLSEKTWMDRERIHEFIGKVAAYQGWELERLD
jgi:hypothetical protein